jgi:phospholipid/cholesterol/gamma-HCH transport system permease protein
MKFFLITFEIIGDNLILLMRTLKQVHTLPKQWKHVIEQAYLIGYATLPMVVILSFFIGAVLALQTGFSMRELPGTQSFLGSIVGLSMCRELGPVMTAFLLAGRVGSAVTAEIASMKVYNEVDSLITMNIPPERFLVLPRLVAASLVMPILTIFSIFVGWYGGAVVVQYVKFINLDPHIYWRSLKEFVDFSNVADGIIKSEIFGILVVLIACNQGLRTKGGPREIGSSVTKSVVSSMVSILFLDYFVTKFLM